jgi:hypothetical protein
MTCFLVPGFDSAMVLRAEPSLNFGILVTLQGGLQTRRAPYVSRLDTTAGSSGAQRWVRLLTLPARTFSGGVSAGVLWAGQPLGYTWTSLYVPMVPVSGVRVARIC